MLKAELARFVDRHTIEFVRDYPHPVERVWQAITDPAEISVWFWTAEFDLRVGGAYRFGGESSDMKGAIAALEPLRRIRFGGPEPHGPEGYMEFVLEPVRGGTRMTFTQHSTPGFFLKPEWPADPSDHPAGAKNPWRPGSLRGWHASFDQLGDELSGATTARITEIELEKIYREHMRKTQP